MDHNEPGPGDDDGLARAGLTDYFEPALPERTALDLDALEKAAAKATEGPWQSQHDFDRDGIARIIGAIDGPDDGRFHYRLVCEVCDDHDEFDANARFIALSREAVPALIQRVRELEARAEQTGLEFVGMEKQLRDGMAIVEAQAARIRELEDENGRLRYCLRDCAMYLRGATLSDRTLEEHNALNNADAALSRSTAKE